MEILTVARAFRWTCSISDCVSGFGYLISVGWFLLPRTYTLRVASFRRLVSCDLRPTPLPRTYPINVAWFRRGRPSWLFLRSPCLPWSRRGTDMNMPIHDITREVQWGRQGLDMVILWSHLLVFSFSGSSRASRGLIKEGE